MNEGSQADRKTVLNGDYFKGQTGTDKCYDAYGITTCPDWSQVGLKKSAQDMIEEVVWNTGTAYTISWEDSDVTLLQYIYERSNNNGRLGCGTSMSSYCSDHVERTTTWPGKVGLMYPSDYGYATNGEGTKDSRDTCIYNLELISWTYSDKGSNCYKNDWLYDSDNTQWTMTPTPASSAAYDVAYIYSNGYLTSERASTDHSIRPVVYLKSSVKIIDGTGEESNPYQLKLE